MITILIVIISILAFVGILYFLFPLVQVVGESMYPTYLSGEIIIGTRLFKKSKLKKGDVVVYHCPTDSKIVIKRIHHIDDRYGLCFYCLGDNLEHSYDSRKYGYVPAGNLVCKVIKQRAL